MKELAGKKAQLQSYHTVYFLKITRFLYIALRILCDFVDQSKHSQQMLYIHYEIFNYVNTFEW